MQAFSKYNDGVKYLLTVIDIFQNLAGLLHEKRKLGRRVAKALKNSEFANRKRFSLIKAVNFTINVYKN